MKYVPLRKAPPDHWFAPAVGMILSGRGAWPSMPATIDLAFVAPRRIEPWTFNTGDMTGFLPWPPQFRKRITGQRVRLTNRGARTTFHADDVSWTAKELSVRPPGLEGDIPSVISGALICIWPKDD